MIKVAVCGHIEFEGGSIEPLLARCAEEQGVGEYSLDSFDNPVDLIDACTEALGEEPYNLVICAAELMGMSGVDAISELNALHSFADDLRVVLCAKDSNLAYDAHSLGVGGYLMEPVSAAEFNRVVGRQLQFLARVHEHSIILRCRDRVHRIQFERLSFTETSDHDQVLHHIGSKELCYVRGSSNDLYSLLQDDGRFFKVGSSYIVNLDHVVMLDSRNGVATLSDGSQISVPVRSRKPLEQALHARSEVAV